MKIHTTRFGDLEIMDEEIYVFEDGIPGFENDRKFAMVEVEEHEPFKYLQSVNSPETAFIVVNPFEFFTNYEFDLVDKMIKELKVENENQLQILSIVNMNGKLSRATANLIAPIVLNVESKLGRQIVLTHSEYTTKHRLYVVDDGE